MTLDLDELEAIGKAAAEAPWRGWPSGIISSVLGDIALVNMHRSTYGDDSAENIEFIATARNNWQAMIDHIRELEAIDDGHSEEIREYNVRISELEAEVERLKTLNSELSAANDELETRVNRLKEEVNEALGYMNYPPR